MSISHQPASVFRVRAHNAATESENKIHDDRIAAAYGFRGALVPGVTVYGYIVAPILDRLGRRWLECGGINVRFHAPCYEGDTVLTRCDGSTATAEREDGSLYASGAVTLQDGSVDHAAPSFPLHPLPEMEQRPVASSSTILPGMPLASIRATVDVSDIDGIPERLLRMANEILVRNFRMSPWIHAGSDACHHRLAACGQELTVTGTIQECFERKGRKFAVAGLQMSESTGSLVATVRHTFIFHLPAVKALTTD